VARNWLLAAGWWASDYVYAVNRQVATAFTRTSPSTLRTGERTPVVVIPGVYESWKFLAPLIAQAHERGHPVHVVESLRFNLQPVVESADHVAAYLEAHDLHDAIILAHSKGGLIGKYVMTRREGVERVRAMLAVATPFGGSVYARFVLAPTLRIFSPEDLTIRELASEADVNSRIVSVYGAFDPHIPAGSELSGAKNVQLSTGGHFRILRDPQILAELAALDDSGPA
jgi:pimeloyl-ACP methyl ester carboxylesterase